MSKNVKTILLCVVLTIVIYLIASVIIPFFGFVCIEPPFSGWKGCSEITQWVFGGMGMSPLAAVVAIGLGLGIYFGKKQNK